MMMMFVLRNCLKQSEPHVESLSSSGNEFQIVGPTIENPDGRIAAAVEGWSEMVFVSHSAVQ